MTQDFYENLRLNHEPLMTPLEFSNYINRVESELFDLHPEYLEVQDESWQNKKITEFLRGKYGSA